MLSRTLGCAAGESWIRSGDARNSGSAGVPEEFVQFTIALPYNDLNVVEEAFRRYKDQIACVIVEPVVGNMGCVPPAKGFLDGLRYLTARENALLILDEVMTGFRVAMEAQRSCTVCAYWSRWEK